MGTNIVSSDKFTFKGKEASAFVSDFGWNFDFNRVYPDSNLIGIDMVSSKTGKHATFFICHRQGDQYWKLIPTTQALMNHPNLEDMVLTIFNT